MMLISVEIVCVIEQTMNIATYRWKAKWVHQIAKASNNMQTEMKHPSKFSK